MKSSHTNGNRKTIIIGGFGPGISTAVAEQFGSNGFSLALIGRNAERVAAGAKELTAKGFRAEPFVADLSKPEEIRDVVSKVRAALGSISALQWTAFSFGAGDLTTASADEIQEVLAVAVGGLVTAVQSILPDLAANKGALLVTNGGIGLFDPQFDAIGVKVERDGCIGCELGEAQSGGAARTQTQSAGHLCRRGRGHKDCNDCEGQTILP